MADYGEEFQSYGTVSCDFKVPNIDYIYTSVQRPLKTGDRG